MPRERAGDPRTPEDASCCGPSEGKPACLGAGRRPPWTRRRPGAPPAGASHDDGSLGIRGLCAVVAVRGDRPAGLHPVFQRAHRADVATATAAGARPRAGGGAGDPAAVRRARQHPAAPVRDHAFRVPHCRRRDLLRDRARHAAVAPEALENRHRERPFLRPSRRGRGRGPVGHTSGHPAAGRSRLDHHGHGADGRGPGLFRAGSSPWPACWPS